MASLSLKTKLAGTVGLLLCVLLSLLGAATLHFFATEFRHFIGRQQLTVLSGNAQALDQNLAYGRELIVKTAASIPPEIVANPDLAQAFFDQRLGIGTTQFFDNGIFLFSANGDLIAEWPFKPDRRGRSYAFRDYFRRTIESGAPIISDPYLSSQPHHHPAVNFTAPLFDPKGQLLGVLAGSLDLTRDNFLGRLSRTRIGETGYYYLFNTDRLMIMHPDPSRVLQRDIPPGANLLLDQAIEGFEGSGETVNSRGVPMLAAFKHLAATNWILAANYPQKEAYAPLHRALRGTAVGVVAALAICTLIFWLVLRRQLHPLALLTRQVRELSAQPEPRRPLRISSGDEIGALAGAFNQLIGEVTQQTTLSRERLDFLQMILDSIPLPVYYKGLDGHYLGCNTAFELSFGIPRAELPGKTVSDLVPVDEAATHLRIDAKLLNEHSSIVESFEQTLPLADGNRHDILFFKAGFRNPQGEPAGLVATMIDITERKAVEAALAEQREFSENLLQNSAVACFVLDSSHRVLTWTRACEELTGIAAAEVLGTNLQWKAFYKEPRPCMADLIIDQDLEKTLDLYSTFASSQLIPEGLQAEGWFANVGGKRRYLFFEAAPIRNRQGEMIAAIETLQDLSALKQVEQALRESEQSYRALIDRSPDAIVVHRKGKIIFANQAAGRLFAANEADQLAGMDNLDLIHPEFRDLVEARVQQEGELQKDHPYIEARIVRLDGLPVEVEISSAPVFYGGKWAVQTILRDITLRKELQEKIWHQANFDALTGLPNRMLFHDRLRQAIEQARREGYRVALMFIDLDHFKEINDTLGHDAGDCLLQLAAQRLLQSVRKSDTAARLGGDEFTVIMPCVTAATQVGVVARRILVALDRPFDLPGGRRRISGSVGIAIFPEDGEEMSALLENADAAMYRAKQAGRNAYCFFRGAAPGEEPGPGRTG
ncbi:sensor domain-containing diguanylate cyclase [Desulfuromonas sp. DDH964]|uniref:sensor domain-containing diguanylate cyclase n=1 Tax=Desulfuromonas sp. DDH964 TaxID=1823759 RepID=UPI00078C8E2B|nr:diguanylate cyclase [Desulfuromonas sp. DDH964]AMV71445.1 response receiver sensor diguanylate cyclase, PAS domain-containing [Desulfuromonas sp. DDH964]